MNSHPANILSGNIFKLSISKIYKIKILKFILDSHQQNLSDIMAKDWWSCMEYVDSKNPTNFQDYFTAFVKFENYQKYIHNINLHQLKIIIYTALAENLFIQFASQSDLYKCTKYLSHVINESDCMLIYLHEININPFLARVKKGWRDFLPLAKGLTNTLSITMKTPIEKKYRSALSLFIPEKFQQTIYEEFYRQFEKINTEPLDNQNSEKVLMQILNPLLYLTPLEIVTKLEECIQFAESRHPVSLFQFFDYFSNALVSHLNFHLEGGWGAPIEQRKLSFTIYTALTQSLFDQFVNEKDLSQCTLRLKHAVKNHTVINWEEVDKKGFEKRLKEQWSVFYPLMYDKCLDRRFACIGLLKSIGLDLNDFTRTFFSPFDEVDINTSAFPEAAKIIVNHLGNDLTESYKLSQLSKACYNTLQMHHRLSLIENHSILHELFGKILYVGGGYLLTAGAKHRDDFHFRITSLEPPYQTLQCYDFHKDLNDNKLIGGYVFKDADQKLTVLTAITHKLYIGTCTIQQLKLDSLQELKPERGRNFKEVDVIHPPKNTTKSIKYFLYKKTAKIKVDQNNDVTVDLAFKKGEYHDDHRYPRVSFFGQTSHYQTKFNTTDFNADTKLVFRANKLR